MNHEPVPPSPIRRVSKIVLAHYHHRPVGRISLLNCKFVAAMSIEQAEVLKRELTDKWVVVDKSIPELKRFAQFTGKVKTVNMSGQALVEFDSGENIGWYDINPSFLKVVAGPQKKEKPAAAAEAAPAKAAPKAVAAGKSPLEMARAQGAGGEAKPKPATGGSPLDMIRKQGAAKADGDASAESAPKKMSPLDMIRKQGAIKKDGDAAAPAAAEAPAHEAEPPAPAPAAEAPVEEKAPAPAATAPSGEKLSPLDMIRKQGAAKH